MFAAHKQRVSSLLSRILAAFAFVVVCCGWAWAFLMEPYRALPVLVRISLALTMFGLVAVTAAYLVKRRVWITAMAIAFIASLMGFAVCVVGYSFDGIEFLPSYPPGPPPAFSLYDASYLLATVAVALTWSGLLAMCRTRGWSMVLRRISIAAIFVMACIPPLFWAADKVGRLRLGLAVMLVIVALAAGTVAMAGSIAVWFFAQRHPDES